MSTIDGADRLSEIWQEMRGAHRHEERNALIADAICATSRLEAAVHEARFAAVRLLRGGLDTNPDTVRRIMGWEQDYK